MKNTYFIHLSLLPFVLLVLFSNKRLVKLLYTFSMEATFHWKPPSTWLAKLPHQSLLKLSKKQGLLMFLNLGQAPTVVALSSQMAKEILKLSCSHLCKQTSSEIY